MINADRLAKEFVTLVQIDSPSRKEGSIAGYLRKKFQKTGARVLQDSAGKSINGESGNLIILVPGTRPELPPIMFNAHLDTVEPGTGIRVIEESGIFRSDGRTILGADDKSGIAILLEVLAVLQEERLPFGPLELVLTVSEETGLWGAKYLDYTLLKARMGYALDTTSTTSIISGAPEANSLFVKIHGLAAHAGLEPERGMNALQIAGQALATMELGRIDPETTANIGVMKGGTARNIVPDYVEMEGEVRSHDIQKLTEHTGRIRACFDKAISEYKNRRELNGPLPSWEMEVVLSYPLMKVDDNHPVVLLAQSAAAGLGRHLQPERSGGGSDANIFNAHGISTVILGTGMQRVHTTDEYISIEDMVRTAELILSMISVYST